MDVTAQRAHLEPQKQLPAPTQVAQLNKQTATQSAPTWWGPLDGPAPPTGVLPFDAGAADVNKEPRRIGDGNAVASQESEEFLRRRLQELSRDIRDRSADIDQLLQGADEDALELCQRIRTAVARKHVFRIEMQKQEDDTTVLNEAISRANRRIGELEAKVTAMGGAGSSLGSSASAGSSEDGATDSVWRECVNSLEGELRRKSARAVELHKRVAWLEEQLGQQLQANDDRCASVHAALREVLEELSAC